MKEYPVTVIMRTKNVADIVGQTLKALFSQSYTDFRLLVVDSGSTDRTLEIVKSYPCDIVSIKAEDYYPGKVLNEAIVKTTSPLIVFLNSDTVLLTPHALSHLLEAFHHPHVEAAFGRQVARPDAEPWVKRDYSASFREAGSAPPWMFLSLPFAAMRRSTWEKRPFYTSAWGSEDNEWGYWAKQHGIRIQYVPKAMAMHSHNYTFRQLYGRRFIEGEADAFIFRGNYRFTKMVLDTFKATLRDLFFYIRKGHWISMFKIPALRVIYYWAYYKGYQWGRERLITGNSDAKKGQETVLSRYSKSSKS